MLSIDDVVDLAETGHVHRYNTVRLHSANGYIAPAACLAGRSELTGKDRSRKLKKTRKTRQGNRAASKQVA
jgi:hypothetical protein